MVVGGAVVLACVLVVARSVDVVLVQTCAGSVPVGNAGGSLVLALKVLLLVVVLPA